MLTPRYTRVYAYDMKRVNALRVRQSLGRVLSELDKDGEPILVEKDRKPRAVLITLRDYQERFVDGEASERRRRLVEQIRALRQGRPPDNPHDTVSFLRELRGELP